MNTKSNAILSASPDHKDACWHNINWTKASIVVRKTQLRIAEAVQKGNWRKVKKLQRLLTHSFYGRCLAVRRVTENRGRKTAGVDGETWGTPKAKWNAVLRLKEKRGYRPKPLRRVWIPKPGKKELRPLGIPTMLDKQCRRYFFLLLSLL